MTLLERRSIISLLNRFWLLITHNNKKYKRARTNTRPFISLIKRNWLLMTQLNSENIHQSKESPSLLRAYQLFSTLLTVKWRWRWWVKRIVHLHISLVQTKWLILTLKAKDNRHKIAPMDRKLTIIRLRWSREVVEELFQLEEKDVMNLGTLPTFSMCPRRMARAVLYQTTAKASKALKRTWKTSMANNTLTNISSNKNTSFPTQVNTINSRK